MPTREQSKKTPKQQTGSILAKSKYDEERKALGIPSWYSGELKKENNNAYPSWYSGSGSILANSKYAKEREEISKNGVLNNSQKATEGTQRDWNKIYNSAENPIQPTNSGRDWDSINQATGLFNQPPQEVKPSSGGLFNKPPQNTILGSGGLFNKAAEQTKEIKSKQLLPLSKYNLPAYDPDSPENQPKWFGAKWIRNLTENEIKKEYEMYQKDYTDLQKGKINIDTFGLNEAGKKKAIEDFKARTTQFATMPFEQFRLYKYQHEENPNYRPSSNPENRTHFADTGSKTLNFIQRTANKGVNTFLMDDITETPSTGNKVADFVSDTAGTIMGYVAPGPGTGGNLLNLSQGLSDPVSRAVGSKISNPLLKRITTGIVREGIEGAAGATMEGMARNMKPKDLVKKIAVESVIGAGMGGAFEGAGALISGLKNKLAKGTLEKIEIPKEITVKTEPVLKGSAFKVKNIALENAYSKYNEAVDKVYSYFNKNTLTPDEMARVKTDLGIDLDKLVSDIEKAESGVPLKQMAQKQNLSYTAGVNEMPTAKLNKGLILNPKLKPVSKEVAATIETPNIKNNILTPKALKPLSGTISETGTNVRGFKNNILDSEKTLPGFKKELKKADISYNPITNEETLKKAKDLVNSNYNEAVRIAKSDMPATAESNTISQLLIQKAQQEGRWEDAIELVEITAKKATSQGSAIQALSMWGKLTPEGMLRYTQKVIDKANRERPNLNLKLKPEVAKEITESMQSIAKMAEGREKTVATAKVLDKVAEQVPPTLLRKISTIQTMAQLLNGKTAARNIIGNAGFMGLENVSDIVGTGIDKAVSVMTGQRTKILPSLLTQAKGFKTGFKLGLEDAIKGIDTAKLPTQFDIGTKTFRKGLLGKLETAMNIELKAPDRAFYQAAYDNSLRTQMKIAKVDVPTEAMKEIAHLDGLYRTFQDENVISKAFSRVKRTLNNDKDFGIGDFIIKYPRTPGSIMKRGLDYSPAGFIRTTIDLAKLMTGKSINQKQFVESTSRALVGSFGLIGIGALLNKLGIITGKSSDDKDVRDMQNELGLGDYKINVSGLKRFISSGFNPEEAAKRKGDTLMNYDWFLPISMGIAIGADINQNKGQPTGVVGSIANALMTGMDTVAEQPVLQGIRSFALNSNQSITKALTEMVKGVPASFVPTFINQIRQLVDNQSRNTYDPNWVKESVNMVKAKIPGLSNTLPAKITPLGKNKEVYKNGSNTPFNVLLNPAFVSKYNPTPGQELVLNIYNKSGLKTQMPKVMDKKIIRKGETITLTPKEYKDLQQYVGQETEKRLEPLAESEIFKNLSPESQAKKIQNLIDAIYQQGKKKIVFQPRGIK